MIFINYKNPHPIYKNRQSINEIEHIHNNLYDIRNRMAENSLKGFCFYMKIKNFIIFLTS